MKRKINLYFITGLILILTMNCNKDTESNLDNVLFMDVQDTTLAYKFTRSVNDAGIESLRGAFEYRLDINQDATDDFVISGRTWPGHFSHTGPSWINDYETIIQALHSSASIAYNETGYSGPCNGDILELNAMIDENLTWQSYVRIYYKLTEARISCSWRGDSHEENYFIGLKVLVDNGFQFGWLDIDGAQAPTIKAYAINLTSNKIILAGQIE